MVGPSYIHWRAVVVGGPCYINLGGVGGECMEGGDRVLRHIRMYLRNGRKIYKTVYKDKVGQEGVQDFKVIKT